MFGYTSSTGNMRRRIELRQAVEPVSETGSVSTVNTLVIETWAEVRELRGKEIFSLSGENAQAETLFMIRFNPEISMNKQMVIAYGGKTYEITSIAELGIKDRLEIYAKIRRDT